MNKEFHYYGTYVAAREAGFVHDDAKKIAVAAQMVDDCTDSFMKELDGEYEKKGWIPTCADVGTGYWLEDVFNYDSDRIKKMEQIWMVFHFLPGNLEFDENNLYPFSEDLIADNTWGELEKSKTICLPNSALVEFMIDNARSVYTSESSMQHKLMWIGIVMHVLADTWAHAYFAGTPCHKINNASEFKKITGEYNIDNYLAPPNVATKESVFYLGHARAGHWPDLSNLVYTYHPEWMKKGKYIMKDNPTIYSLALLQMKNAMKFIKGDGEFNVQQEQMVIYSQEYLDCYCSESEQENTKSFVIDANKDLMGTVRNISMRTENASDKIWKKYIGDKYSLNIVEQDGASQQEIEMEDSNQLFTYETAIKRMRYTDSLKNYVNDFQNAALAHFSLICNKLKDWHDIR